MRSRKPRLPTPSALRAMLVVAPLLSACSDPNQGIDPPRDSLFFPSGLVLDPRTPEDQPAQYLIVTNGNNDLSRNAGTITVLDLQAFFDRWATESDPMAPDYVPYPYCDPEDEPEEDLPRRCVLDVGSSTSQDFPCRRLGLLPQVVECDERPFVVDGVRIGDFATVMGVTTREPTGIPRIFVPVRGDPSVTYVDVEGTWPDPPDLECGQPRVDGRAVDEARCRDDNRLRWIRNDDTQDELSREPFNIAMAEGEGYRYAVVSHAAGLLVTVIDLDGVEGVEGQPAMVDAYPLFDPIGAAFRTGGFGLAHRPCGTCTDPDDPSYTNAPTVTQGCTRPMIYGGYRYQLAAANFTIDGIEVETLPTDTQPRNSCYDNSGQVFLGPFCAAPEDIGKPCAIVCDPKVRTPAVFTVAGVDPLSTSSAATLGNIQFADECGEKLYLVQTNPGALLQLDTSLDIDNETLDITAGPPLEVCDQPTRLAIWREGGFGFVSCYQAAELFVVDLDAWIVVDTIITGTGPHDLVVDPVREMLYAANALEASVSVIDLGQDRPTRFKEVARIGLREPFRR